MTPFGVKAGIKGLQKNRVRIELYCFLGFVSGRYVPTLSQFSTPPHAIAHSRPNSPIPPPREKEEQKLTSQV